MSGEPKKDVIRETDAEAIRLAKTLLRTARHGALAVLDPAGGAPMASRVAVATDHDGAPLILVSTLSAHTPALLADARCSLLVGEPGKGDPLAHPRMTIACRAARIARDAPEHQRIERRYLARQPKAKLYAGFGDFSFFRLEAESASLNGGFGKAYQLTRADIITASPALDALAAAEASAVEHMNAGHADAVDLYARHFARADGSAWVLTGIDADGMDLSRGDAVARVFFASRLADAAELRPVLVAMAREARAATAS